MPTFTTIRRRTTAAVLGLSLAIAITGPVFAGQPKPSADKAPNTNAVIRVAKAAARANANAAAHSAVHAAASATDGGTPDQPVTNLGVEWTLHD